jgi:hypothetical protein
MANRILRRGENSDDRRTSNPLPIELEARYKIFGTKTALALTGFGKTLNVSSGGFTNC